MIKQRDVFKVPDGEYNADRGLYLLVKNNGAARSWIFATKVQGKRYRRGIGSAKLLTLAQAKAAAETLRVQLRTPFVMAPSLDHLGAVSSALALHHQKRPEQQNTVAVPLFKDCYLDVIERIAKRSRWKDVEANKKTWRSRFNTYVLPTLGDKKVSSIRTNDIVDLLNPIWETKNPTAVEIREFLFKVFKQLTKLGYYPKDLTNPAEWEDNLDDELAPTDKVHTTQHCIAPTVEELRNAIPKLLSIDSPAGYAIVFGILTACRQHEFLEIKTNEFDFKKKIWVMPQIRRKDKKKEDFIVPLSKQAIDLLRRYQKFLPKWIKQREERATSKGKQFMPPPVSSFFPGLTNGVEFISHPTPSAKLSQACGRKVDMHGCRSTFSDWCAENQKDRETAEKALMHETGNRVERIYKRTALLEQRRTLMQEWADALFTSSAS